MNGQKPQLSWGIETPEDFVRNNLWYISASSWISIEILKDKTNDELIDLMSNPKWWNKQ